MEEEAEVLLQRWLLLHRVDSTGNCPSLDPNPACWGLLRGLCAQTRPLKKELLVEGSGLCLVNGIWGKNPVILLWDTPGDAHWESSCDDCWI